MVVTGAQGTTLSACPGTNNFVYSPEEENMNLANILNMELVKALNYLAFFVHE